MKGMTIHEDYCEFPWCAKKRTKDSHFCCEYHKVETLKLRKQIIELKTNKIHKFRDEEKKKKKEEKLIKMKKMREAGLSYKEIGKHYNVSKQAIHQYLNKY